MPTLSIGAIALLLALPPAGPARDTAVFAGGCFWGVEAVFEHVRGVVDVKSGYAGGDAKTAEYEIVGTGTTNHAESVQIVFDPSQVAYGDLLRIFFSVAHDPTQRNRQGPDVGKQYRSAVFYANDAQRKVVTAYIAQLDSAKVFRQPIATEVTRLDKFYPAEDYHQDFMRLHPNHPYIVAWDRPKLDHLKKEFPKMYVDGK